MTTNECKMIRRELDEAEAMQPLSTKAANHLRGCEECRSFDSDRRTLHGLMASLEPVAAPPDFDFRLRARIAREKSGERTSAGFSSFLRIPRLVAALAMVLLVVMAGIVVRNWMTSSTTDVVVGPSRPKDDAAKAVAVNPTTPGTNRAATGTVGVTRPAENPTSRDDNSSVAPRKSPARDIQTVARKMGGTATRESGVTPAEILDGNQAENADSIVRVPLDGKALQIIVDDGRGATRTISLPMVSFGSQRLMASQSFVPSASAAKGVW